ncbi:hypothetical protein E2562_000417 [Oryza meyeriana var. granulata]|uniref:Disease resistance N-terminal domain-containing protein n=1 Tax=Oryza meyeriana var. granulata TaxID=110450 RepID=A0A6G1CCB8_9ORYZ|nr:hypothetical protein E2562_000417 [Oryza meyeriana var. granulata]
MEAALVNISTGVMGSVLAKLSKQLEEEYAKLKGLRRKIMFIRDELITMSATLNMLADSEELNPQL